MQNNSTHSRHRADEAERVLLSGVLEGGSAAIAKAEAEGLDAADFAMAAHAAIWRALCDLVDDGHAIDVVAVVDRLRRSGHLDTIGGPVRVSQLQALQGGAATVATHARTIVETAALRRCAQVGQAIVEDAVQPMATAEAVRQRGRELLDSIHTGATSHVVDPWVALNEVMHELEAPDRSRGISTGFAELDHMLGGWRPGALVVVAARPAMGKTAFVTNCLTTAAAADHPSGMLSLEMPAAQIYRRAIAARSRVYLPPQGRVYSPAEWSDIQEARGWLAELPFAIDDRPGQTLAQVLSSIARLANDGAAVVAVDYLTLIQVPSGDDNRASRVGDMCSALKAAAREHSITVLLLCQLNRGVEQRTDKRPLMSDLRESGSIEQDADAILMLFRAEYYLREKTPPEATGVAEVIVAKNRHGPTGSVPLRWSGEHQKFDDLVRS